MATLFLAGCAFAAGVAAARVMLSVIYFTIGIFGLVVLVTIASIVTGEAATEIAVRAIALAAAPQVGYVTGFATFARARPPPAGAPERASRTGGPRGSTAAGEYERACTQESTAPSDRPQ